MMAQRFDNIKLEKGMYREAGRSFTQTLEREDKLLSSFSGAEAMER